MRYSHPCILWCVLVLYASLITCVASMDAAEVTREEKLTLPGEPCHIQPRSSWTPQEQWVWKQVCEGNIADFNTADGYGGKLDPQKPLDWPVSRVLRSAFLETILLHKPWRSAVPRQGVHIKGAWFKETLDLSDAELTCVFRLEDSRFDSVVRLSRLRTPLPISFGRSTFDKVMLRDAQIGGLLSMNKTTVTGELDMHRLRVGGGLFMNNGATFSKVILQDAQIGGLLDMSNATVKDELNMGSLHVGSSLLMRDRATFAKVILWGAQIESTLELSNATVTGELNMEKLHVGSSLFMNNGATFAKVILWGAQIEGALGMENATVTGELDMGNLHVGGTLSMYGGNYTQARTIDLVFATIGSSLVLVGSRDLPSLNLTGTTIDGELRLTMGSLVPKWQPGARLTLRNTKVGALHDALMVKQNTSKAGAWGAWPDTLELAGFTYERLGGLATQGEAEMAERPVSWFEDWLEKQPYYAPQPYEHLAKVLRDTGHQDKARDILYTSQRREHEETTRWWQLAWWGLTFQWLFIGYGYYNFRVLWWVLVFCIIGTTWLYWSGQGPSPNSPRGTTVFNNFVYSLNRILPIIQLEKKYEDTELQGIKIRTYFYFLNIMGYILASFLVAGLAGLTKQ